MNLDIDVSKICVIIPCYNEQESISKVLDDLDRYLHGATFVVINDCSRDNTIAVAMASGKAEVINLPSNLGIGGAVQTGLKYAYRNGFKYALKFDGDGQHKAEEIIRLLEPIVQKKADVTIGSRFLDCSHGFQSTALRRIGIKIFRLINSLLIGQWITDNTSGFRAYNYEALKFLADKYPAFDYPEPEEVVLLGRNHFRLCEISTPMAARAGGTSSINAYQSIYFMLKVLFAVFMVALRPAVRRR
ncbi:MAG: glycosyltransferase family 2 protein [Victivallales bacterium]|nr:glycosyltransferase family 2 protein [Victivallales bacterium]